MKQGKRKIHSTNNSQNLDMLSQATGEINKIFDTLISKKANIKTNLGVRKQKGKLSKRIKKDMVRDNYNKNLDLKNGNIQPVRYLDDGLPVYRLEDINLGK